MWYDYEMRYRKKHHWLTIGKIFCMAVVLCLSALIALDKRLTVRTYRERTSLLQEPVRLAVITDLHAGSTGTETSDLWSG